MGCFVAETCGEGGQDIQRASGDVHMHMCVSVCACACGVARWLCKWVYRGMFWNCVLVAEGESLPRKAQFRPIPPPVSWQPYHLEVAGRPSCYDNGGLEWQLRASQGQEPWQVLY